MKKFTIYHNPRCSKSRQALQILRDKGIEPNIIEYLKRPLQNDEKMFEAMVAYPKIIERPIVTLESKAVLCRPPENILKFI